MAKRRETLQYILNNFTLGEIQSGVYTPREVFQLNDKGEKVHKTVFKLVKGTKIPASTLSRMLLPESDPRHLTPRKKTIDKIHAFYKRFAYNAARSQGAGQQTAKKAVTTQPSTLDIYLQKMRNYAKTIAKSKNVPLQYVITGMTLSNKFESLEDWENYIEDKNFEQLDITEKRKTTRELANFPQKISYVTQKIRLRGRKAKRRSTKRKRK